MRACVSSGLLAGEHIKPSSPPSLLFVRTAGKEYVGIVRLHNAIESEHTLARVRVLGCGLLFFLHVCNI